MRESLFYIIVIHVAICMSALGQNDLTQTLYANSADCPVKILGAGVSANGTQADLLSRVILGNSSSKTLVAVQIAWTVEDLSADARPLLGIGAQVVTLAAPGDVIVIGPQNVDPAPLLRYLAAIQAKRGTIGLAVVMAKFNDGSIWRRALDSTTRFREEQKREEYIPLFKDKLDDLRLRMLSATSELSMPVAPGVSRANTGKCLSSDEAKTLLRATAVRASDCGWMPVCNPSNKDCAQGSGGCATLDCTNPYYCHLQCCMLWYCTGQILCI